MPTTAAVPVTLPAADAIDWRDRAACRPGMQRTVLPDDFDLPADGKLEPVNQLAARLCLGDPTTGAPPCPVQQECRDFMAGIQATWIIAGGCRFDCHGNIHPIDIADVASVPELDIDITRMRGPERWLAAGLAYLNGQSLNSINKKYGIGNTTIREASRFVRWASPDQIAAVRNRTLLQRDALKLMRAAVRGQTTAA